ncbi:MAG: bifunctional 4-hydroxy-2-oxoglutarate aldolase/2-dehydro-3-deoxy-phosphogluconate aldolase [Rhodospirillales bacterium]|nr:bifunctional 4-hydroxy-2-oxoglutarate aldolase/2-dehydro-3-deoxy-phosphogluconate aldolase [Rhodospirillales bacterium]
MPNRQESAQRMQDAGLVAIIRAASSQGVPEACRALVEGGIEVFEITMTTPGALEGIAQAQSAFGDTALVGVGSVLDAQTARRAVDAGAQFVVSPVTLPEVIAAAAEMNVPVLPGALTPTEIYAASQAGADFVKVFPANHFGPRYFKDVLAPMPHLKLTPTGGVNLDTMKDWFDAGAACLGVGSSLVRKDLLAARDFKGLAELAKQYVAKVKEVRG